MSGRLSTASPPAASGPAAGGYAVECVRGTAELARFVPAWEELAKRCMEPNPFYEPGWFLPALEAERPDLEFLFVLKRDASNAKASPILCGFFPLEFQRRYKGVPAAAARLWPALYGPVGTPLVRQGHSHEAFEALFNWVASARRCPLLEFPLLNTDGPVYHALSEVLYRRRALTYVSGQYTRAMYHAGDDPEACLAAMLDGQARWQIRRRCKLLSELGRVEYTEDTDDAGRLQEFLDLEASGWKGREGSAIASSERTKRFFETAAQRALARGGLLLGALRLNGRMIAARAAVRAGSGAYVVKIAYDEQYSRYSPGILLHIETMKRIGTSGLQWVDSCTGPHDTAYKRIWKDRRTVQDLLVSSGRRPGDFLVSLLPLLRWLKRGLRRPAHPPSSSA